MNWKAVGSSRVLLRSRGGTSLFANTPLLADGQVRVDDDVERVKIAGIDAVAGEDAGGESALQRGKAKYRVAIAAESELDEVVAESTDSVVEKDRREYLVD